MAKLRPLPSKDYVDLCYCNTPQCHSKELKVRCLAIGHCAFLKSGTHAAAQHPIAIRVGVLTDYYKGMTCDGIKEKWGVSHGYVGNMVARADMPKRSKVVRAANIRAGQSPSRKLIPYAGKE